MLITSIDPKTMLGTAVLTVSNLGRSVQFYEAVLGFNVHSQDKTSAALGVGGQSVLILVEDQHAVLKRPGRGVFHVAIVVPTRLELARLLQHLVDSGVAIQGLTNHFVSESIYLADPDGIGLELYADTLREVWQYPNGRLHIGSAPMDVQSVLGELSQVPASAWSGLAAGTRIGHVHLHVASVPQAEAFYREVLGFSLVVRFGTVASFLAAGGYHHHIGVREGLGPAPDDALGLRTYTIELPDSTALDLAVQSIQQTNYAVQRTNDGASFRDPSNYEVRLVINRFSS